MIEARSAVCMHGAAAAAPRTLRLPKLSGRGCAVTESARSGL